MTIEEIIEKKKKAEREIDRVINDFQDATGLDISEINYEKAEFDNGQILIIACTLEVKI